MTLNESGFGHLHQLHLFVAFSFHSNDVLLVFHTRARHVSGIESDSISGETNPANSSVGSWHLSPSTRAFPRMTSLTIIMTLPRAQTGFSPLPENFEVWGLEEQAPGLLVTGDRPEPDDRW